MFLSGVPFFQWPCRYTHVSTTSRAPLIHISSTAIFPRARGAFLLLPARFCCSNNLLSPSNCTRGHLTSSVNAGTYGLGLESLHVGSQVGLLFFVLPLPQLHTGRNTTGQGTTRSSWLKLHLYCLCVAGRCDRHLSILGGTAYFFDHPPAARSYSPSTLKSQPKRSPHSQGTVYPPRSNQQFLPALGPGEKCPSVPPPETHPNPDLHLENNTHFPR